MYDDHYGLSGRPFQLTPDPKFWFDTDDAPQGDGVSRLWPEPGRGLHRHHRRCRGGQDHARRASDGEGRPRGAARHQDRLDPDRARGPAAHRRGRAGAGDRRRVARRNCSATIERGLHAVARVGAAHAADRRRGAGVAGGGARRIADAVQHVRRAAMRCCRSSCSASPSSASGCRGRTGSNSCASA